MAFTPEKRAFLVGALGEDRVKALETDTESVVQGMKQLGIEYKEASAQAEGASVAAASETDKIVLEQLGTLTEAVKGLTTLAQKNADEITALKKPLSEQMDDAFLAKVAGAIRGAERPTESAQNVQGENERTKAAAAEADDGDFFKQLVEKSFGIAAGAGGAGAVIK